MGTPRMHHLGRNFHDPIHEARIGDLRLILKAQSAEAFPDQSEEDSTLMIDISCPSLSICGHP